MLSLSDLSCTSLFRWPKSDVILCSFSLSLPRCWLTLCPSGSVEILVGLSSLPPLRLSERYHQLPTYFGLNVLWKPLFVVFFFLCFPIAVEHTRFSWCVRVPCLSSDHSTSSLLPFSYAIYRSQPSKQRHSERPQRRKRQSSSSALLYGYSLWAEMRFPVGSFLLS